MKRIIKNLIIFFMLTVLMLSAMFLNASAYDSVTLNKTSIVLKVSQTFKLDATVTPQEPEFLLIWRSDNEAVAKVDKEGRVTAVSPGEANVFVNVVENPDINENPDETVIEFGDTENDTEAVCRVMVEKTEVKGISLNRDSLTLRYKSSTALTATLTPENADDKTVIWSSSDTNVAKVDGGGRVVGTGRGTAMITAKAIDGGCTAVCRVTVKYAFWQWLIFIFLAGWIWY